MTTRSLLLLVDDHELVRELTVRLLKGSGHEVVAFGDAAAAVELARERADELALLITDVSMPGVTGPELAAQVREHCPGLPVLFVTGFAAGGLASQIPPDAAVLEKPFTREDLLAKVREATDRPG